MRKPSTIEQELVQALMKVAYRFSAATGKQLSTIGRAACDNARFFDALLTGGKSCTLRIYSDLMQYFSDHWPEGAEWPEEARRPPPRAPTTTPPPPRKRKKRKD